MDKIDQITTATILDNIPALVYVKDTNNRLLKVNNSLAVALNLQKDKIENKSCWELCPHDLADIYWEHDQLIQINGEPIKNIVEEIVVNGVRRWHRTDKYPLKNEAGKVIGIVGISIDIHANKKEHEQLVQLQTAMEFSHSVVIVTDTKGIITYVNPRFTQVTGYTRKEALGKSTRMLKSGKLSPSIYTHLWDTITNGNVWSGEFLNKTKSGEYYWEVGNVAPVRNTEGEITNFIKVSSALTDLKRTVFNVWNVFEDSNNLIVVLDKTMQIIYCNQAVAFQLGFPSSNELIGKSWKEFIPTESKHIVELVHSELIKGSYKVKEFVNDIQDINGNTYMVRWFNSNINGNTGLTFSIGVVAKSTININDSVETIRKHFKMSIDKDKHFILAMKKSLQHEI